MFGIEPLQKLASMPDVELHDPAFSGVLIVWWFQTMISLVSTGETCCKGQVVEGNDLTDPLTVYLLPLVDGSGVRHSAANRHLVSILFSVIFLSETSIK